MERSLPLPMVARRSAKPFSEWTLVGDQMMVSEGSVLKFAEKREDGFPGCGIEVTGGLISEKNFGAIDESAGDGNALLLAAREFCGAMAETMSQSTRSRASRTRGDGRRGRFPQGGGEAQYFPRGSCGGGDGKTEKSCRWCCSDSGPSREMKAKRYSGHWRRGPEVGRSSPAMRLRSVDLPEPEEPRRARNSFGGDGEGYVIHSADAGFAHGVVAGDAI